MNTPVHFPGGSVIYHLGADEDPSIVKNVDAEVILDNGTRWSATFLTLDEIDRVMNRWSATGEELGGSFFQCPDLVIVREGGIETMTQLIAQLHATDKLRHTLKSLS